MRYVDLARTVSRAVITQQFFTVLAVEKRDAWACDVGNNGSASVAGCKCPGPTHVKAGECHPDGSTLLITEYMDTAACVCKVKIDATWHCDQFQNSPRTYLALNGSLVTSDCAHRVGFGDCDGDEWDYLAIAMTADARK